MKEVKGAHGETELQPVEYVPSGPASIAGISDKERLTDALRRLQVLESQVASLQASAPRRVQEP